MKVLRTGDSAHSWSACLTCIRLIVPFPALTNKTEQKLEAGHGGLRL
jgi:hypothetical protein